jgi:hypothetical protein
MSDRGEGFMDAATLSRRQVHAAERASLVAFMLAP